MMDSMKKAGEFEFEDVNIGHVSQTSRQGRNFNKPSLAVPANKNNKMLSASGYRVPQKVMKRKIS